MSELVDALLFQIRAVGLPEPETEVRLITGRRFRSDLVYRICITPPIAIEVDGATWTQGRHTRGAGFESDSVKINELALLGFRFMRFTRAMIEDGRAVDYLERALRLSGYLPTPRRN